jgi:hypothetical protein
MEHRLNARTLTDLFCCLKTKLGESEHLLKVNNVWFDISNPQITHSNPALPKVFLAHPLQIARADF